ncbi:MAG: hypothetical protein ACI8R1_000895 [Psychrobacter glaciei]|jgi:hypothetical protein
MTTVLKDDTFDMVEPKSNMVEPKSNMIDPKA